MKTSVDPRPPPHSEATSSAGAVYRTARFDRPKWVFRVWTGMQFGPWLALLKRNHFAISRRRLGIVLFTTCAALVCWALALVQRVLYGRRISAATLALDPVFVIGHWRSGTTFLHELIALDDRFVFPTTLECFGPSHCLVSRWLAPLFTWLIPARRPMDRLAFGWDRPQEEEWALTMLGLGSPYEVLAFPNHRRSAAPFLDLLDVGGDAMQRWKDGFWRFLQTVQFRADGGGTTRRLLLKSPTHTARLKVLCEMFPGAVFVHLVREPRDVFASTVKLWTSLFAINACQEPILDALPPGIPSIEDYVYENFEAMYRSFERDSRDLPLDRICHVRFGDLTEDPIGTVERIYETLALGPFSPLRERLAAYVAAADLRAETYSLPAELAGEIDRRWNKYFERYR